MIPREGSGQTRTLLFDSSDDFVPHEKNTVRAEPDGGISEDSEARYYLRNQGTASLLVGGVTQGYRPTVMRTMGQPVFSTWIFFTQLLYNSCEPLSGLFVWATQGKRAAVNFGLLPSATKETAVGLLHHFDPVIMSITMWLYLSHREEFERGRITYQELLLWPMICILVQKVMVAYKYAMLTAEEFQSFAEAPVEVADHWNKNLQLLTGWLPLPDDILFSEIQIASYRAGLSIRDKEFIHEINDEESLRSWAALQALVEEGTAGLNDKVLQSTRKCDVVQKAQLHHAKSFGSRRIAVVDLLAQLVRVARDGAYVVQVKHLFLSTIFLALIPPVRRILELFSTSELSWDKPCASFLMACVEALKIGVGGGSPPVLTAYLLALYLVLKYNTVVTMFMAAGAAHYHRTYLLTMFLAQLARPVRETRPNLPQLQMETAASEENLENLLHCFEIAVQLGPRYRARLDTYVATVGITSGFGLVYQYILLGVALEQAASGDNTMLRDLQTLALVTCINSAICFGLILAMIMAAAEANDTFSLFGRNLVGRRWRRFHNKVKRSFVHCQPPSEEELDDAKGELATQDSPDAFELAVERVNCLAATSQVRIVGFGASNDLAYGIAGTVYPMMALMLGKLYFPSLTASASI
mmetsp:Transcript_42926/g.78010  ORF Transcript_42926/g.78010 Transcript_42926/m.78010 type:complete len:640 (-) Transcript_42926:149-2068(-)